MKNIKDSIESLKSGLKNVNDEKYKDLFCNISEILDDLHTKIEEIMINQAVLAENFKYMDEDISDIQEELFEEVSIEDLEEMEEEYKEISCTNCGKNIFIEESVLQSNEELRCPYCNQNIK